MRDVSSFSGSREFAAYLGLTPRQNSSASKDRLGPVSKMGKRYLRKLLAIFIIAMAMATLCEFGHAS
jgi:transposase